MVGEFKRRTLANLLLSLFQYLGLIIAGTGSLFNVIFHVGVKEPPSDALPAWLEERKSGKHKRKKVKRKGSERNGK